ncbi:YppG family protein [Virgibacillus senegalensis]|uniref:YppG family protein n=1 Tax=Virgibacillus senegalensis TaxID=1499679 RepID=UPI00069FF3CC|nr:YppG family protein [Virgibacillus senegalensis]
MNEWRAPYPEYRNQFYGAYQPPFHPSQMQQFVTPNANVPTTGPPYNQFVKPPVPPPWPQQYPSSSGGGFGQVQGGGFINYFQDKNGQMDIDKMLNTVGQMANTFQQMAPLFKGFSSFIKGIR